MARLDPKSYPIPEIDYKNLDWKEGGKAHDSAFQKLLEASAKATEENPVGFLYSWGVGDGSAYYLVKQVSPLVLQHVPYSDAWTLPGAHIRGLTLKDIVSMIRYSKKMSKLFGKTKDSV